MTWHYCIWSHMNTQCKKISHALYTYFCVVGRQVIDENHIYVLNNLPPPPSAAFQSYNLRQRRYKLELPNKTYRLIDSNFIQQMLYLHSYYRAIEFYCV